MSNSKTDYNTFVRANLPYYITYDSVRNQYVTVNGKRFVTYKEAQWYMDYIAKFGYQLDPTINYAANGFSPGLVTDFANEVYATSTEVGSFSDYIQHTRSGAARMVDSDGVEKWSPHNLAINSTTPATQSITVVSGVDYTVECAGAGSITLSGAGTGSVAAGSPVEVTASTTNLTLTVVGSLDTMWAYRSDLGGMINNPDTGSSYVPTVATAVYLPRRNAHVYNGTTWVNEGLLYEEAGTNLLLNTETLSTQNATVTNEPHTLSFTGTGTVTLSGTSTAGPLVGAGTGPENRVSLTFTPTAGTLTLTVSGAVSSAQLEAKAIPTSWVPTLGAQATRAADIATTLAAYTPWNDFGVSIQMSGLMTYADTGVTEHYFYEWKDGSDKLSAELNTAASRTGQIVFRQKAPLSGLTSEASATDSFAPGINVPFNIASYHTPSKINGAISGVALPGDTSPTALADLSNVDFEVGIEFNGFINQIVVWSDNIDDAGIEEATS
jgi:hypothetical protein